MKTTITILAITLISLTASAQIRVSTPRQSVQANGKIIVMTDSQVNYLRGFNDPAINAALNSHATIKFNETADNIISLLDRQTRGNKANYYGSFRNQSTSILAHL